MPIPQPAVVVQSYRDSCTVKYRFVSVMKFTAARMTAQVLRRLPRLWRAAMKPGGTAGRNLCRRL
jgi:hypothetical protein